jgi:hypothetical protein
MEPDGVGPTGGDQMLAERRADPLSGTTVEPTIDSNLRVEVERIEALLSLIRASAALRGRTAPRTSPPVVPIHPLIGLTTLYHASYA